MKAQSRQIPQKVAARLYLFTEFLQSSHEHNSLLKTLQPSLPGKSNIQPLFQHRSTRMKNHMVASWANEHVRKVARSLGKAFNKRTSIVLFVFTSCSFGALSKSGHKKLKIRDVVTSYWKYLRHWKFTSSVLWRKLCRETTNYKQKNASVILKSWVDLNTMYQNWQNMRVFLSELHLMKTFISTLFLPCNSNSSCGSTSSKTISNRKRNIEWYFELVYCAAVSCILRMELETYCTKLKVVKKKYCNSSGSEGAMQGCHITFVKCSVCFV